MMTYIYNEHELIAVMEITDGEILAPAGSLRMDAGEEEAFAFFESNNIFIPEHYRNVMEEKEKEEEKEEEEEEEEEENEE